MITAYRIPKILLCLSALLFFPITAHSQSNVFQKGVNAVKEFFKGDKSDTKQEDDTTPKVTQKKASVGSSKASPSNDYSLEQLYDLSLDENLVVPKLGNARNNIKAYQLTQARKLVAGGQKNVETMRNGEVIVATIASDDLFYPNDTVLKPNAGKHLRPFLQFLNVPDMYRMLLAMHSDDTGTEAYTDVLTSSRVLAVLEWFQQNAASSDYIIPYAMGASEPLRLNNSVNNRMKNRRLEIYLVPGKTMIDLSSKGKLQ